MDVYLFIELVEFPSSVIGEQYRIGDGTLSGLKIESREFEALLGDPEERGHLIDPEFGFILRCEQALKFELYGITQRQKILEKRLIDVKRELVIVKSCFD